jgi:hypothetical protein
MIRSYHFRQQTGGLHHWGIFSGWNSFVVWQMLWIIIVIVINIVFVLVWILFLYYYVVDSVLRFPTKTVFVFLSVYVNEVRFPHAPKLYAFHMAITQIVFFVVWNLCLSQLRERCSGWVHFLVRLSCRKKKSPWKSVNPHCFWLKCRAVAENQYKDSHCLSAYIEVLHNIYKIEVFWSCCSVICTVRPPVVALQVETSSVNNRIL